MNFSKHFYWFVRMCGRTALFAVLLAGGAAVAADKIVLQLKWLHQAQFAGYYAAQENGYYADENLEVKILEGGSFIDSEEVVAARGADVVVDWAPAALLARERGISLVNIAQPFAHWGYSLICRRDSGVKTIADLPGKTIAVWPGGDGLPLKILLHRIGIAESESANAPFVKTADYADTLRPLASGETDCASGMSYSEVVGLARAGLDENETIVFRLESLGAATLEDGLWVLESRLQNDSFADAMARFVRASLKGWRWAEQNQEAAAALSWRFAGGGEDEAARQKIMMREIAKLTAESDGALHIGDYERTVQIMLDAGLLSRPPQGAQTSDIINRARREKK